MGASPTYWLSVSFECVDQSLMPIYERIEPQ